MALPTWTNIPDADVDVDSPLDEDLFTALRDNASATRLAIFGYSFTEQTTTSTTWATAVATLAKVYVPDLTDYTGIARKFTATIEAKVSAGTGEYRLKDSVSGTAGTGVTTTSTSYAEIDVSLNIDASWKGTVRTLVLEYQQQSSGTVYARAENFNAGRMEY